MAPESLQIGISCYPTYGGSGVVASELALRLVEQGHSVHILSYELPARLEQAQVCDVDTGEATTGGQLFFHRVAVRQYPLFDYPPYSLALANEMVKVARKYRLDLMHVHYAVPNAVSALLAKQILAPERLTVVTTLHGTDITLVGNDPSYLETTRWSIEQSDAVTAVSPWLEEETRRQFETDNHPLSRHIEVVPNFVEAERFAACEPRLGERPTLVHVSNFRRIKRASEVVKAFALLHRRLPSRLRMVGEGPGRAAAMQQAEELGVADAVEWLGNAPRIERALDGCALFLLASKQESFGLAALEALAAGVPVVCTGVGGVVDVVHDGETGRLVNPRNGHLAETMASVAEELLTSAETWQAMSRRGRSDARERFSIASILQRYLAVYQNALAAG